MFPDTEKKVRVPQLSERTGQNQEHVYSKFLPFSLHSFKKFEELAVQSHHSKNQLLLLQPPKCSYTKLQLYKVKELNHVLHTPLYV